MKEKFFNEKERQQLERFFYLAGYDDLSKKKTVRQDTTYNLKPWNDDDKITRGDMCDGDESLHSYINMTADRAKGKTGSFYISDMPTTNAYIMLNQATVDPNRKREFYRELKSGESKKITIYVESRKEKAVYSVRAFYIDVDFKQNGKHLTDMHELKQLKHQALENLLALPIPPQSVVRTANGIHAAWFINPKDYSKIDKWYKLESIITCVCYELVSNSVDFNVGTINRILRVPFSYHLKEDNPKDEKGFPKRYKCSLLYLNESIKREDLPTMSDYFKAFTEDCIPKFRLYELRDEFYNHTAGVQQILDNFKSASNKDASNSSINAPDCTQNENTSNLPSQQSGSDTGLITRVKTHSSKNSSKAKKEKKSSYRCQVDTSDVESVYLRYPSVKAIVSGNSNYFSYLKGLFPSTSVNYDRAKALVKSVDLRTILEIDCELNKKFHSIFHWDCTPSDFFYEYQSEIFYFSGREVKALDIFGIVQALQQNTFEEAANFVYKMFGLNVQLPSKYEGNKTLVSCPYDYNTFIQEKDKRWKNFEDMKAKVFKDGSKIEINKFNRLEPVYKLFIYEAWDNAIQTVEKSGRYIHYNDVNIMFTSTWVMDKLKLKNKMTASRYINELVNLGLLKKVTDKDCSNLSKQGCKEPSYFKLI